MKKIEEDKELKGLIKSMDLDSPGKGFSSKVMNQIFELESYIEKLKSERILGKSFWIIFSLFTLIAAALVVVSVAGINPGESQISDFLSGANNSGVSEGYKNVFETLTSLPLSVAGILLASSLLVFLERFLSTKYGNM